MAITNIHAAMNFVIVIYFLKLQQKICFVLVEEIHFVE